MLGSPGRVPLQPTSVCSRPGTRCPLRALALARPGHLSGPRGVLALPSPGFVRALPPRPGFRARDGRGSAMRYFRALAYVPPHPPPSGERGRGSARGLCRVSGAAGADLPRPPSPPRPLARRPSSESLRVTAGAAALTARPATRGRPPGAGLRQPSSPKLWRGCFLLTKYTLGRLVQNGRGKKKRYLKHL